jgi:C4-dicarboxylate transporter DctQ subunit
MPKIVRVLNHFEELVLGFTLLGLAIFVFIQVVLRYGFHFAFSWAQELGRYLTIFLTFLGASLGVKYGTHFSMEAIVKSLPHRYSHLVRAIASFLSGVFFILIIYFSLVQIAKLYRYGACTATLHMPMYVPYIPIPLFSITISMRFIHAAYTHVRKAFGHEPDEL